MEFINFEMILFNSNSMELRSRNMKLAKREKIIKQSYSECESQNSDKI